MIGNIYLTLQGIIFEEFPKNSSGVITVLDQPIRGWKLGDQAVQSSIPGFSLQAMNTSIKDVAFGTKEYQHSVSIKLKGSVDETAASEAFIQEWGRLMNEALTKHRRIWVLEKCPICLKYMLSPEHYQIDHAALIATFRQDVIDEFTTRWEDTHLGSHAVPSLKPSGLAGAGFLKMCEQVLAGTPVSGLANDARDRILQGGKDLFRPLRLLYDCTLTEAKTDAGEEKAFLHLMEFTWTAKELVRVSSYGPDNVPTTAFS